jgi:hypothetical protein
MNRSRDHFIALLPWLYKIDPSSEHSVTTLGNQELRCGDRSCEAPTMVSDLLIRYTKM